MFVLPPLHILQTPATFGHPVTVSMIQHTLCYSCTTVYQSRVQARWLCSGVVVTFRMQSSTHHFHTRRLRDRGAIQKAVLAAQHSALRMEERGSVPGTGVHAFKYGPVLSQSPLCKVRGVCGAGLCDYMAAHSVRRHVSLCRCTCVCTLPQTHGLQHVFSTSG